MLVVMSGHGDNEVYRGKRLRSKYTVQIVSVSVTDAGRSPRSTQRSKPAGQLRSQCWSTATGAERQRRYWRPIRRSGEQDLMEIYGLRTEYVPAEYSQGYTIL